MNNKPHILVTDDDQRLRLLLKQYLENEGFRVTTASSAEESRGLIAQHSFDAMVLDVMMPDETGVEFALNEAGNCPPILMLTAMSEVEDRIKGLESGADDYLIKPFEPKELCLRLQKIIKRRPKISNKVKFGDYSFDIKRAELFKGKDYIDLSTTELALLKILAVSGNKPVSREEISRKLNNISERSIDVQITRLRKKIETDPKAPIFIKTERGKGYLLRI